MVKENHKEEVPGWIENLCQYMEFPKRVCICVGVEGEIAQVIFDFKTFDLIRVMERGDVRFLQTITCESVEDFYKKYEEIRNSCEVLALKKEK